MLWSLLLLQLGVYALAFLVTPWDIHEQLNCASDRLFLQAMPLGGLLLTLHLSYVRQHDQRLPGSCRRDGDVKCQSQRSRELRISRGVR